MNRILWIEEDRTLNVAPEVRSWDVEEERILEVPNEIRKVEANAA